MRISTKVTIVAIVVCSFILGAVMPKFIVIYTVNGESMEPSIENGSLIVLERISPIVEYDRGDVVSIKGMKEGHYSLKRIVGIPGDTISYYRGKLFINSKNILENKRYITNEILQLEGYVFGELNIKERYEIDITHRNKSSYIVPDSSYFILGDNILNSSDSRSSGFIDYSQSDGRWLTSL